MIGWEKKVQKHDRDYGTLVKKYYKDYEIANIFKTVKDFYRVASEGTMESLLSSVTDVNREVRKKLKKTTGSH